MPRRRFILPGILTVTLLLAVSLSANAQDVSGDPVRMDLRGALRAAYNNNPVLQAAREELMGIQEKLPQAQAGWKPSIGADAGITKSKIEGSNFGGDGSTSKDVIVELNQPLYRGGKTTAEMAAARYLITAQNATLKTQEQEVLRDAAIAYADVFRDRALLELSENNREVIERQLEATQDRFTVGELTRTDVSQAEARLAAAKADIIGARGDLRTAEAVFRQVVGGAADGLAKPRIEVKLPRDLETALSLAEDNSPRVVAVTYAHKAAEEDVDGVWAGLLPELDFVTSWNKTYDPQPGILDEQTTKSIGITASLPLYEGGAVRSRIRQAKHDANQRYLEIMDVRREVRRVATENWESLQAAQAEIRARISQVEAASVAREGVHAETEFGSRTVLDALDADQELLDAQVALVTAQRNEISATFELMATLGLLTPQELGFPEDRKSFDNNLNHIQKAIFNTDVDRVKKTE